MSAPATSRVTYAPGFHPEMPLEHYYADPAGAECGSLNSSGIPYLRQNSPLHFAVRSAALCTLLQLQPAADIANAAAHRGRVVHRLALGKGEDYTVLDFPDFRTKAAQEARDEAEAAGHSVILRKDYAGVQRQADRLRAHLHDLFMGHEWLPECAVVWEETTPWGTVLCRALVDAYCPALNHGADVKASTDASSRHAKRRMEQGGYDVQNTWYSRGLCNALSVHPADLQFSTVFAESKEPFASQAFQLSEGWRSSAWNECELALRLFAQCQQAGRWPGYSPNPQLLTPPTWLITQRLEAELGGEAMDLNDEPPSDFDSDGGDNA